MLLLFILAVMHVPAGLHSNQLLYTDLSGSVLLLGDQVISSKPGSSLTLNLPENFSGDVQIFDISGRLVLTVQSQIPTALLAPGLYNAVIDNQDEFESIRFTVIR